MLGGRISGGKILIANYEQKKNYHIIDNLLIPRDEFCMCIYEDSIQLQSCKL